MATAKLKNRPSSWCNTHGLSRISDTGSDYKGRVHRTHLDIFHFNHVWHYKHNQKNSVWWRFSIFLDLSKLTLLLQFVWESRVLRSPKSFSAQCNMGVLTGKSGCWARRKLSSTSRLRTFLVFRIHAIWNCPSTQIWCGNSDIRHGQCMLKFSCYYRFKFIIWNIRSIPTDYLRSSWGKLSRSWNFLVTKLSS